MGSAVFFALAPAAFAQAPTIQPPRTITDVLAILDQEKPNPELVAANKRTAEAEPPADAQPAELGKFYYKRAVAKLALGDARGALADAQQALPYAENPSLFLNTLQQFIGGAYLQSGNFRRALSLEREREKAAQQSNANARLNAKAAIVRAQVGMGDLAGAEATLKEADALLAATRQAASAAEVELRAGSWQAALENARGSYLAVRGRWKEAEESFAKAEAGYSDAIIKRPRWPSGPEPAVIRQVRDATIVRLADVKRSQGRLAEAEVDARRALLNRLHEGGKYQPSVARFCLELAGVLRDQGRFTDYERLARVALEIYRALGFSENSPPVAGTFGAIANALRLQERWNDAAAAFAEREEAMKDWEPRRRNRFHANAGYIYALYNTGRIDDGIAIAEQVVALQRRRVGEQHFEYAIAEGDLAIGQALATRDDLAAASFAKALPLLSAESGADDDSESAMPGARQRRAVRILAAAIALQARQAAEKGAPDDRERMAVKTFELSDLLRGHSVAGAIAASSARSASRDPVLAGLARQEQDLRKQAAADFELLNATLALPPAQRDDAVIANLRAEVARLRSEHAEVRRDIGVRFPDYADLIDPKPATVAEIQAVLGAGEAFVSFYFGAERGFVWAIPKSGAPAFAVIEVKGAEIDAKVRKLREALEPNAATVSDIPAFDLATAHELYQLLLKPVEAAWKPAKTLVVATNGALGSLPLGVLPVAAVSLPQDKGAAFATYRTVPWLARTHGVALVPSAAAFRTLRGLPAAASGRDPLIGFGDPLFNREQAKEAKEEEKKQAPPAAAPAATPLERRSAPHSDQMASATIASLPRLPDTADELRSVATALKANADKVLNLGAAASEENVRKTDLAKYRVVDFATHGLMAGELNGLTQPALALSAPEVTGQTGDGLLTLEEILTLKLNADWVVLSACNTGAGNGAGAEAASGLGRAFFYAGTRAILVTNWSVHTESARDLVSDLFRRQAADSRLSRAEALRQAELALMDGKGFVDDHGKTLFSYAHPLFWAPYSIIGDGS